MANSEAHQAEHDYHVTSSSLAFGGAIVAVRQDTVAMPGGSETPRDVVEHFGSAAIVAMNDSGEIALLRQYRHPVRDRLWELPAGLLDRPQESALECARRELLEEAGLSAGQWGVLSDIVPSPGISDEACRIFLATDLTSHDRTEHATGDDDEESEMQLEWFALQQAMSMVFSGQIVNAAAVAGIMLAQQVDNSSLTPQSVDVPFRYRPQALSKRRETSATNSDHQR